MNIYVLLSLIENPKSRLLLSLVLAQIAFLSLSWASLEFRLITAWTVGVLCFLILVLVMMFSANAEKTQIRSQRQEIDNLALYRLVVLAAFASLFIIGTVLAKNKDKFTPEVGLSILAILCSWFLMHTMFALHYAAFYYRQDYSHPELEYVGGLKFSGEDSPSYLDFMYFAFTLGMTSQTSDTAIIKSSMRRLCLGHTVVSFFFYSVIFAMTVGIASGFINFSMWR